MEIKSKLEDLLALLQQDTAQLVDDSDPAKAIFKTLHGQIPADVEEVLFQVASSNAKKLCNALPTELRKPNSKRKCCK